jgi:hypothetical protein
LIIQRWKLYRGPWSNFFKKKTFFFVFFFFVFFFFPNSISKDVTVGHIDALFSCFFTSPPQYFLALYAPPTSSDADIIAVFPVDAASGTSGPLPVARVFGAEAQFRLWRGDPRAWVAKGVAQLEAFCFWLVLGGIWFCFVFLRVAAESIAGVGF